jgi:hypothetical protein
VELHHLTEFLSTKLRVYFLTCPKQPWTADERAAAEIKSQETVRIPRNADPDALPDFAAFVVPASEPQRGPLGKGRARRDDQPAMPR